MIIVQGDADYICNWLGNKAWTEALEWDGHNIYNQAPTQNLLLSDDGTKIGDVKSGANFTFVRLHAGGHMIPHDQPAASLNMFNRWLSGEWIVEG